MNTKDAETKLVFLRVGWMKKYQGLKDDSIKGGGRDVAELKYGHEILNFLPLQGMMYGYVAPKTIDIKRLGGGPNSKSISGILIIWVASNPKGDGTKIVGWYDNATLFRERQTPIFSSDRIFDVHLPPNIQIGPGDIGKCPEFIARAAVQDCHLIPENARNIDILCRGKGKMGQRNIWYADAANMVTFREKVVQYVRNIQKEKIESTQLIIGAVLEGEKYRANIALHKRNAMLVLQKKGSSDYRCEACGMSYKDIYGEIGKEFIIAHHEKTIGGRDMPSTTELRDIRLVCSNCHYMLHTPKEPLKVEDLRIMIEEQKAKNNHTKLKVV